MLSLAVLLVGIWLILFSQITLPSLLTLIFGIVVAVLAALTLLGVGLPNPPVIRRP